MQHLLFTRAAHWSYEDEIRRLVVLNHESKPAGEHHFIDFAGNLRLLQVIAGINCRVPRAEIESALDGHAEQVEIIKARASLQAFRVTRRSAGLPAPNTLDCLGCRAPARTRCCDEFHSVLDPIRELLDVFTSAHGIRSIGYARFVSDNLLRAKRNALRFLDRQA